MSGLANAAVESAKETPAELTCPICRKMLTNAVLIPCCMESACDDCVRTALIEKSNFHCPLCSQPLVPDQLLPNNSLRRAVENFKTKVAVQPLVAGGVNVPSKLNVIQ